MCRLPRTQAQETRTETHQATTPPSIISEPTETLFRNQEEWQYFQLFRTEAAAESTGFFDRSL
jgi:hypothetical protein